MRLHERYAERLVLNSLQLLVFSPTIESAGLMKGFGEGAPEL